MLTMNIELMVPMATALRRKPEEGGLLVLNSHHWVPSGLSLGSKVKVY